MVNTLYRLIWYGKKLQQYCHDYGYENTTEQSKGLWLCALVLACFLSSAVLYSESAHTTDIYEHICITHAHMHIYYIYIYTFILVIMPKYTLIHRAHRPSSKLLDYFLRSNKSNINQSHCKIQATLSCLSVCLRCSSSDMHAILFSGDAMKHLIMHKLVPC